MKIFLWTFIFLLISISFSSAQESDNDSLINNLSAITTSNIDMISRLDEYDLESIKEIYWGEDETNLLIETYSETWSLDLSTRQLNVATDDIELQRNDDEYYVVVDTIWETEYTITSQIIGLYLTESDEQFTEIPITLYNNSCEYACQVNAFLNPDQTQLVYTAGVEDIESAFVNLDTGKKTILPPNGYFSSAYSPDGSLLATLIGTAGYIPQRFSIFDTNTGNLIYESQFYASDLAFSNSGDLIAIGIYDDDAPNPNESIGIVHIYDVQQLVHSDGEDIEPLATLLMGRPPSIIEFSPDDRLIAFANDNENQQLTFWGVSS